MRSFSVFVLLATLLAPAAIAVEPVEFQALLNGGFNTFVVASPPTAARSALDHCIGVGHQAFDVMDGEDVVAKVAADPTYAIDCDPKFHDVAQLNAWEKAQDMGFAWSNDAGTKFYDFDSDGENEAIIPQRHVQHTHNLWQSIATPQQAMSADFRAFEFTLEHGVIPANANNQIGLALSPGFEAHPWVGIFWEGAVMFRANDMTPDEDGRIRMDPATQGEIICPGGYQPCFDFRAAFNAADVDGKRTLLGQARVVQVSFWSFSGGVGPVVIDDVAFRGQKTAVDGILSSI